MMIFPLSLIVTYGIAITVWVLTRWVMFEGAANSPGWLLLLPLQLATLVMIWRLQSRTPLRKARRLGWRLLFAAFLADTGAILAWNYLYDHGDSTPFGTVADLLYLANYALLAGACIAFYVDCGGLLRQRRTWIDFVTLGLSSAAGLSPFLVFPLLQSGANAEVDVLATTGYVIGIVVAGTTALMLRMQIEDWRRDPSIVLVIVGILIELTTDLYSVSMNERGAFALANLDDLGAVWSYVAYAGAVVLAGAAPARLSAQASEGNVHTSLPVFALLSSVTLLLGTNADHASFSRAFAMIVLVMGTGLLIARQRALQSQIDARTRALVRANEERNNLIENLAHDLRTPLTALRGYLDRLNMHDDSLSAAERGDFLNTAVRQTERLARRVRELFELVRLDDASARLSLERFTPAEVMQDIVQEFAPMANSRYVCCDLVVAGEAELAQFTGDIGLFQRMVENLVDNAVRHTPSGGRITLSLRVEAPEIVLEVTDTGQGIAPEDLDRIFDRYERAGTKGPGAGLGLAIVRRILELHHGSIAVDSELGQGTRFQVRLPLAGSLAL